MSSSEADKVAEMVGVTGVSEQMVSQRMLERKYSSIY